MSQNDFSVSKQLDYRTAVAAASGSTVQVGDVEIVSMIEEVASNRRRLLTTTEATTTAVVAAADPTQAATTTPAPASTSTSLKVETKVMVPAGTTTAIKDMLTQTALEQQLETSGGITLSNLEGLTVKVNPPAPVPDTTTTPAGGIVDTGSTGSMRRASGWSWLGGIVVVAVLMIFG